MNQSNQGNNSSAPPAIPVKRKRGRPRKDQSLNRVESARVPPGFQRANGNQPRQVDPIDNANDGMVGRSVTGVVEAVFDAGYLLTVRIGNSNTSLRGVVFKPGHYVPVTTENDVVPHVQMIRRNEIHLPTDNQSLVRSPNSRSRERNEQHLNYLGNGSPPANQLHRLAPRTSNLVASKGKYASLGVAPSVPPVGARGTVVPVVLQPVNISNGLSPANQLPLAVSQDAHMMASKGKHVQTVAPLAVCPPNGSKTSNQALAVASQVLPSQPQTSHQVTAKGLQNENSPFNQIMPEVQQREEAKSMKVNDMFTSQPSETHVENSKAACKSSVEDSGVAPEREIGDMNEPLFIEPLQVVRSDLHNQSASFSKPLENNRTGRMTELLQALQENMMENQVPQVEHLATGSRAVFHELKSPETDFGDEETVHSQKRSRASSV